jgi:exonuclease SbcD
MAALQELRKAHDPVWLELVYDGQQLLPDLRERVQEIVADSPVEILRLSNRRLMETTLAQTHEAESLDSLSADDVFERCLDANEIAEAERTALRATYRHALNSLNNDDPNAL